MSAENPELKPSTGNRLLAEIQSRYRSDRWNPVGGRFGYIEFDPEKQKEFDLNRLKILEARRVEGMYQHFADAMGVTIDEIKSIFDATDKLPQTPE